MKAREFAAWAAVSLGLASAQDVEPEPLPGPVGGGNLALAGGAVGGGEILALELEAARKARVEAYRAQLDPAQQALQPEGLVLHDFRDGRAIYVGPHNENSAISITTDQVRLQPDFLSVDGDGLTVGVWEVSLGNLNTHAEWNARFTVVNANPFSSLHAAHVIGTIAAAGDDPLAMGMAPAVSVDGYDSVDDVTEMLNAGAGSALAFQNGSLLFSNHSYGAWAGWAIDNDGNPRWYGPWPAAEEPLFGQYSADCVAWDDMCWRRPYILPFRAAGNQRNDAPPAEGTSFRYQDGGVWRSVDYDSDVHPQSEAFYDGGYDTTAGVAVAKNVMTVGAVEDAVLEIPAIGFFPASKSRWLFNLQTTEFSSWGPTDDGRIKPDIVANGASLYSTSNRFPRGQPVTQGYEEMSGTSMASPSACGSAVLLQEYYLERLGEEIPMKAATLKGLILHTADDLGNEGPDYQFGWGLMNTEAAALQIDRHFDIPENDHIVESAMSADGHTYSFYWDETSPEIRATLCYTDRPGTAKAGLDNLSAALINDIDLVLTGPGGSTHLPFRLDPADPGALATRGDNDVDNVEQILLDAPVPGLYTLTLTGEGDFVGGAQQYSLILSGNTDTPPPVVPQQVTLGSPYQQPFDDQPYASAGWTYASTNAGRVLHTGTALRMDDASAATADDALNLATLHLDLAGQSNVQLWVWWDEHGDEDHTLPSKNFTGTPNGDGIAVSPDGVTWRKVADLHDPGLFGLTIIDLDPLVAAAGFAYTADFQVRFFQYDNASYPNDGITLRAVDAYIRNPGELRMAEGAIAVVEGGDAEIEVLREGGVDGTVSCSYQTLPGTAAGDFTPVSGTLTFGAGETSKTITVPTQDNLTVEASRRFTVRIHSPGGGATLGAPTETEVTIQDDDQPAEMAAWPDSLHPTALTGTRAPSQTLWVINEGGGPLNYEVTDSSGWITTSVSGTVQPGSRAEIVPVFRTESLLPGRHRGTITVTDLDGFNPPAVIPVTLTLGYPGDSGQATLGGMLLPAGPGEAIASEYPATFAMPKLRGRVSRAVLVFSGLDHGNAADLDVALLDPEGRGVLAMSDCLEAAPGTMKFAIADGGPVLPPAGAADSKAYAPTNRGAAGDPFKFPGPEEPLGTRMSDFNGVLPEGGWQLYIMDDKDGADGHLDALSLSVETVWLDDALVEVFDGGDFFDLSGSSLLYTPADTAAGYEIHRTSLNALPMPVAGAALAPPPDGYATYTLANDEVFYFYGQKYTKLWIGENGDIAFADPGAGVVPGLEDHVALPRLSGCFADLKPGTGGLFVAQTADRVVVTWSGFVEAGSAEPVDFQIELFFDGRIRTTYGVIGKLAPLVGVSRGWGDPAAVETLDLSKLGSRLELRSFDLVRGGNSKLVWASQPGVLYEIERSEDLDFWKVLQTVPGAAGSVTPFSFKDGGGNGAYYRIVETPLTE